MSVFKKILFPVDFSERSAAAAPFVHSLVTRHGAELTLLHVIQPPTPMYMGMDGIYAADLEIPGLVETLLGRLKKFAAEQFPKLTPTVLVEYGDPATFIREYAEGNGFDLIMLPTHGYGTFRRLLLGSVTAKVLHDTSVAVWTDAHAPEPTHRAHPQPRHIVCGIDLKSESARVVDFALETAAQTAATLEVVHGVPDEYSAEGDIARQGAIEHYNAIQNLVDEVATQKDVDVEKAQEPEINTVLAGGEIAKLVREVALRKRADLVIIGRGRIQTALGGLRAHTYSIVRESPCPVISV